MTDNHLINLEDIPSYLSDFLLQAQEYLQDALVLFDLGGAGSFFSSEKNFWGLVENIRVQVQLTVSNEFNVWFWWSTVGDKDNTVFDGVSLFDPGVFISPYTSSVHNSKEIPHTYRNSSKKIFNDTDIPVLMTMQCNQSNPPSVEGFPVNKGFLRELFFIFYVGLKAHIRRTEDPDELARLRGVVPERITIDVGRDREPVIKLWKHHRLSKSPRVAALRFYKNPTFC